MERCIDLATISGWTEAALGKARLLLSRLYRKCGVHPEETEVLETKAMETLNKYLEYLSKWVADLKEPTTVMTVMFDDLLSTDDGRYCGIRLLQLLWGRRRGDKTVTFYGPLEQMDITLNTGL